MDEITERKETVVPRANALPLCLIGLASVSLAQEPPRFVDQNWSEKTRRTFWFIDQGSRLMPLDWFKALERADSKEPFAMHLDRFGFVSDTLGASPNALPIGFAAGDHRDIGVGIKPDGKWAGLTCAACHTGKI